MITKIIFENLAVKLKLHILRVLCGKYVYTGYLITGFYLQR